MSLKKQAKSLNETQTKYIIHHLSSTRYSKRNLVMFLLSVDAGLRAKEIASISWDMVTDASGNLTDSIRLQDKASKGSSGGIVYISKRLKEALVDLRSEIPLSRENIILSRNINRMDRQVVVNWFFTLYRDLGFEGCSSHSGRRTAITKWARKISSVGGSLRDVQTLARHSSLQMTQKYIEVSEDAMKRVVG